MAAQITAERLTRGAAAAEIAKALPPGRYHASGHEVRNDDLDVIAHCDSHWDACLVLLAFGVRR